MSVFEGMQFATIPELLDDRVAAYGNRTFLYYGEDTWGFEDIRDASRAVAKSLASLGIGKGDKVALMMSNRPEYLFIWFGLSILGAVEVPLNTAHRGSLLRYILAQSDSSMLIAEAGFLEQVRTVIDDLPVLERIVILDGIPEAFEATTVSAIAYEEMPAGEEVAELPAVEPSDPMAIAFTSGTTGPSKGAVLPQQYPLLMAGFLIRNAEYTEDDCLYNALPLFHGNAQFLSTLPALASGARMVLAKRFSASAFWDDVRRYNCTEFNYIGGIIPILLKADPKPDDSDNPLRVMVGAGAPRDLSDTFEKRFGVTLLESYGMSEIGIPTNNTLRRRKLGSCGFQNSEYDVALLDDSGREVGPNEPGELLIRPKFPNGMMLEYYGMPEKTVEAWRDLWFHTGDYLLRDEEGFFYFVDRKKDALRRRGENISSYEVEKEVNAHAAVLESAAVAVKSELGEDEVLIVVKLRPGCALSPLELVEHCKERMAGFMVPRYVRFLEEMPKTPTERIQKFVLREQGVTADTFDREAQS